MGTTDPPSAPAILLGYGRQHKRRWRRWVLVLLGVGLVVTGWTFRTPLQNRIGFLYWQKQCLNYSAPADQVVFEGDIDKARSLASADPAYFLIDDADWPSFRTGAWPMVGAYRQARPRLMWNEANDRLSRPPVVPRLRLGESTLYMGRRSSPELGDVLVAVDICRNQFVRTLVVRPSAISRSVLFDEQIGLSNTPLRSLGVAMIAEGDVRIFAGQPDPKDASHFTISFVIGDEPGIIDGYLKSDGSVTLTNRGKP